jgi:hypothetical protein
MMLTTIAPGDAPRAIEATGIARQSRRIAMNEMALGAWQALGRSSPQRYGKQGGLGGFGLVCGRLA